MCICCEKRQYLLRVDAGPFRNSRFMQLESLLRRVMTYLAQKWYHMMLTQTKDLNILHYDQLIVILMEYRPIYKISHILLVPLREEQHGPSVSLGCAE